MNIEIKKSKNPIKYEDAIRLMEERLINLNENRSDELIWILEHDHIYTAGTSYDENEILDKSIKVLKTNRGGKITYHGPGQQVFYFIFDLKQLPFKPSELTKKILETTNQCFHDIGLDSTINEKDPGIYVNSEKVASIGMRIKKNYSYHGISINFETDTATFNTFNPCGLDVKACNLVDYINIDKKELINKLKTRYIELTQT